LPATWRRADCYGFLARDGVRLRYACWNVPATAARGTVVVQQGRAEFIEKYAMEVVGELLDRGFAVFALDWRGQGLSNRPLSDRSKGHIADFATYQADFDLFLDEIVSPLAPRPILALGHSLGGHIVLRHLAERRDSPLAAAICVSPMTGLCRGLAVRTLVTFLSPLGRRDTEYMVSTGPYDPQHRTFATNDVTSDERRYRFTDRWFAADSRLALGGPTIGWLKQAFFSMDRLWRPGVLEKIERPLLVVSAGADRVVDSRTHAAVVARIRAAKLVTIQAARHEIMMEIDILRAQFWQAFDRLAGHVGR
jgi:lysophospholipase